MTNIILFLLLTDLIVGFSSFIFGVLYYQESKENVNLKPLVNVLNGIVVFCFFNLPFLSILLIASILFS